MIKQHYHHAHYDENDTLTRLCGDCGEDLLHESHIRDKYTGAPRRGRSAPSNPPKSSKPNQVS